MLFILNKAMQNILADIKLLAGDNEFAVLLTADAVFMLAGNTELQALGAEDIFIDSEAASERGVELNKNAEAVSYADMADLIMDEYEKVICL